MWRVTSSDATERFTHARTRGVQRDFRTALLLLQHAPARQQSGRSCTPMVTGGHRRSGESCSLLGELQRGQEWSASGGRDRRPGVGARRWCAGGDRSRDLLAHATRAGCRRSPGHLSRTARRSPDLGGLPTDGSLRRRLCAGVDANELRLTAGGPGGGLTCCGVIQRPVRASCRLRFAKCASVGKLEIPFGGERFS